MELSIGIWVTWDAPISFAHGDRCRANHVLWSTSPFHVDISPPQLWFIWMYCVDLEPVWEINQMEKMRRCNALGVFHYALGWESMREVWIQSQGPDGSNRGVQAALALCWTGLFNQNFSMLVGFTKCRICIWRYFRIVIRDALKRKTSPALAVLGAHQCPCTQNGGKKSPFSPPLEGARRAPLTWWALPSWELATGAPEHSPRRGLGWQGWSQSPFRNAAVGPAITTLRYFLN